MIQAPQPAPWPLITEFTLRELDARITVGPQNYVRDGVVRVLGAGVEQVFTFSRDGSLSTNGQTYPDFDERDTEFTLPTEAVRIPGIQIFYNVKRGWLRVERTAEWGEPLEIKVDFPGAVALQPMPRYPRWR